MPAVEQETVVRRGWTAAQVRDLIDESRAWPRYELIDGELLVTPSPGVPHQMAVGAFFELLKSFVDREGLGHLVMSPADLELIRDSITQPDLFVFLDSAPADPEKGLTWRDINTLVLAIEIISPSSIRNDRVIKRDFYMDKAGISEYWVVDLDARIVERWTRSSATPMIDRARLRWQPSGATAPLVIDLETLFEEIRKASGMPRRI
ncbi:MAG TPA: Uma2 family endonuclease [Gemmatimonadaceae bacterium]|nr:Uma2 family endonuclease [Gemmatimonadaceae bacterium]